MFTELEPSLIEKLEEGAQKYAALTAELSDPEILRDAKAHIRIAKERAEYEDAIALYEDYKGLIQQIAEADEMRRDEDADPEFKALAEGEWHELSERAEKLTQTIRSLLRPKNPYENRDLFLEIRAGTGGEEAALFVGDLMRMYAKYAERQGWKVEIINSSETGIGGFKEVILSVTGKGAYRHLQYESGVHRVQRVPKTEASGRVHTSTVTVAVIIEAEEVDIEINTADLRIDTYCASGPGGQGVNTTYSAVRITHIPSGEVVTCQDERSQIKNKARAMRVLRSRLLEVEMEKQEAEIAEDRRSKVGTGGRSEKIRTYNFKENRVTDHRINLSLYQLDRMLEGEIDPMIEGLVAEGEMV
ncbi:MAG: peptide chain release factor 1 [Nitrospiria bacterium]